MGKELQECHNCKNCKIIEDRSDDMRPPMPICSKDHNIIIKNVMDFIPNGICDDFVIGDPEYL